MRQSTVVKQKLSQKSQLQNSISFATGPEFCPPKGFQNTSLVCWQLKTEVLQLPQKQR
jgi:hypothetical protein